jgi:hypothetical protein
MTSDRIDDLIALAALGELSEPERRELDEAAANDPIVAADLDEALAAAAGVQRRLAEDPSPALRASVLAAIATTPQEPSAHRPAEAPVVSLHDERQRRRIRPAILAAAAAVALFVAGGVVLLASDDDASDPIAAVVEAPDATRRTLEGEIDTLTVVYSASEQALVVEGVGVRSSTTQRHTSSGWSATTERPRWESSAPTPTAACPNGSPMPTRPGSCSASPRSPPAAASRRHCRSSPRPDSTHGTPGSIDV